MELHRRKQAPDVRWTVLLTDAWVLTFSLWTVAANITYSLRGSLAAATAIWAVLLVAGTVIVLRIAKRGKGDFEGDSGVTAGGGSTMPPLAILLVIAAVLAVVTVTEIPWLRSTLALVLGAFALVLIRLESGSGLSPGGFAEPPGDRPVLRWSVLSAAVIIGALLPLFLVRPIGDDAGYYARAAVLANDAWAALPDFWTVYRQPGVQYPYALWPFVAVQDFAGLLTWITGWEPMEVASWILAPCFAALMVLAYARLSQVTAPRYDLWIFILCIFYLLTDVTGPRANADFAFVRSWEGKSVLAHAIIPLTFAYGLRFGAHPRIADALRLFGLQICAIGMTAVGVWISPTALGIAILAGIIAGSGRWKTVALVPLLALYPVAAGIFTLVEQGGNSGGFLALPVDVNQTMKDAARFVFGFPSLQRFWYCVTLLACFAAPQRKIRALSALSAIVVFGIFSHPWFAEPLIRFVTTPLVYWRIFWLVPFGLALGGVVLVWTRMRSRSARIAMGIVLAGAATGYFFLQQNHIASKKNWVKDIHFPALQVPHEARILAEEIGSFFGPDVTIAAPAEVAGYVATLRNSPRMYAVRRNFLSPSLEQAPFVREGGVQERRHALGYLDGKLDFQNRIWRNILSDPSITIVVGDAGIRRRSDFELLLEERGFRPVPQASSYLVWVRDQK